MNVLSSFSSLQHLSTCSCPVPLTFNITCALWTATFILSEMKIFSSCHASKVWSPAFYGRNPLLSCRQCCSCLIFGKSQKQNLWQTQSEQHEESCFFAVLLRRWLQSITFPFSCGCKQSITFFVATGRSIISLPLILVGNEVDSHNC